MSLTEVIALLQDGNKKYEALYQEHEDFKSKYARLYQDYMKLQNRLLCQDCKTRCKKRQKANAPNFVIVAVFQSHHRV